MDDGPLTGDGAAYQDGVSPPWLTYDVSFELTACDNGGGGDIPDPDVYIPCGEQEFCVMIENKGTYDETAYVNWEFFQYAPDKQSVDSGTEVIDIDAMTEEEVCLFTFLFEEEGVYEVEVDVQLDPPSTDCVPENNGPIVVVVGVDCCGPGSCFVLDPEYPDGENNWYVSPVTVTVDAWDNLCDIGSGIEKIVYIIDGVMGEIPGSHGTFVVDEDGVHLIEVYAVDGVGNEEEEHHTFEIAIDATPPTVDLVHETYQDEAGAWMVDLTATAGDVTSGMNRVEFKIDASLELTLYAPPYDWTVIWEAGHKTKTFYAYAYDDAGNSAYDSIDGINSHSHDVTQRHINSRSLIRQTQTHQTTPVNLGR
jgi:hypothetical protein